MPCRADKPLEDREFPDETDLDGSGEDEPVLMVRCPACDGLVWDEAQQCPHCKEWLAGSAGSWRDSRKWYVRGGLYVVRTYLLNLLFWLVVLAGAGLVIVIMEIIE